MTKVGLVVHRTFHSLHSRNFRLFFIGQAVSVTGTWMQMVASAWLVLRLTGSGVALGVQTALTFAPILVIGAWGGVIADRFDKRRVLIATQAAFAVLALALWSLTATGAVRLWMVFVLSLLQGLVTVVDNPTRQSFYAEMVGPRDLANAVSLNSAVMTGTRIVGPALAGLVIATLGLASCFLLNGVSYLAVIAGLWWMRADDLHRHAARAKGGLREGLRYVWRTPELRWPLLLMAVIFALSFNFSVLLPLLAQIAFHGGAGTYGTLLSLMGVGSLMGALVLAHAARPTKGRLAASAIAFGLFSVGAGLAPSLGTELAVLVPLGVAAMTFMITGNSMLQLISTPEMRGRVMALYGVVFLGLTPVGAPLAGFVGEHLGPRFGLAAGGVIAAVAGLIGLGVVARNRRAGAEGTGLGGQLAVEAPRVA